MSTQIITRPKCQTCGRKIPTSGMRPSSIEFRCRVNEITTLDKLNSSKKYLASFVKSRFRIKECVSRFLEELGEQIMLTDFIDPNRIYNIRI